MNEYQKKALASLGKYEAKHGFVLNNVDIIAHIFGIDKTKLLETECFEFRNGKHMMLTDFEKNGSEDELIQFIVDNAIDVNEPEALYDVSEKELIENMVIDIRAVGSCTGDCTSECNCLGRLNSLSEPVKKYVKRFVDDYCGTDRGCRAYAVVDSLENVLAVRDGAFVWYK